MKYRPRRIPQEFRSEYKVLFDSEQSIETSLGNLEIEREEIIKNAVKDIDIQKEQLLNRLDKIRKAMEILHPTQIEKYNPEGAWKEKVIWVLRNADRLLPISSITGKIRMLENDFETELNPIIRLTVRRMAEKKELIKYEDANITNIHYGLPEWFINGNLRETYYF